LGWNFFVFSNVHHSFSKLKWIVILVIKRERKLEIGKIHFYNTFEHFWFKFVFGLENHECSKCIFNKSCSFLCDKKHGCIIYMMHDQGVIIFKFLKKHSCKLGVKNTNFGLIDQHMNATCHMHSLEKDFSMQSC